MEFRTEVEGVDARTLEVVRKCMEFTTRIRQVSFGQLGNNDAATLDADLESVQFGGNLPQAVVGVVQTFDDAGMTGIVKPMSAQEQVKSPERVGNLG